MTRRLYYNDAYLNEFRARVVESREEGRRIYLDQTAFYPESGGQLSDLGTIDGIAVAEILDEGDRVAHVLSDPVRSEEVQGVIYWPRRFDHMQQHSGQHLLSAVFAELFDYKTVSVHLGAETSTVDLE